MRFIPSKSALDRMAVGAETRNGRAGRGVMSCSLGVGASLLQQRARKKEEKAARIVLGGLKML